MSGTQIKLGTRARVELTPMTPPDKLLEVARQKAPDGSIFDDVTPFFWQVRASSNRLDHYDTRMRPGEGKTLDNFARGLADGVSYLASHNERRLGWGQSLTGHLVETNERDPDIDQNVVEVYGELFTIPGLELEGQSTDSMIAAIRAGVWRDVSVGFYATDIECSICGEQSFQWWKEDGCKHLPGAEYKFEGKTYKAFAWINDGELAEISQVYKGASPAAAVIKAQQMMEEGALTEEDRAFVERRHGVRLFEPARSWAVGSVQEKEETDMPEKQNITDGTRSTIVEAMKWAAERNLIDFDPEHDALGDAVYRIAKRAHALNDELVEAQAATERITEERDEAQARIKELEPQANDGKRYRNDLIADTLAAGVRAFGNDFREDMYRGILENASIDQIRGMKDDFTKQGDGVFASRHTKDGEDEKPAERKVDPQDADRFKS